MPATGETTMDDDALTRKIEQMERDIDVLQNKLIAKDKKWWADPSLGIALLALLFSFGTTWVSYKKADAQDIQQARQELRGLLQRLAALPKENLEASRKYANDPGAASLIGGFINEENSLLARQASEIARKLPQSLVSPTEYYAVAVALENTYELSSAREFLRLSVATATDRSDFNSEIGALRTMANLDFLTGKPDDGRAQYQNARAIFARYPDFDQYTKVSTGIWTELSWASSEAVARAPEQVRQHLAAASSLLDELPPSPGRDGLTRQIDQASRQYAALGVVDTPTAPTLMAPRGGPND